MKIVAEVVLGLAVATFVGWIGDRLNHGKNREAQALERIAAAADRLCPDLGRPSMYQEPDR